MTHTEGPWTVQGVHIGPSRHFRAYAVEPNICEMTSSLAPDEVAANARLIAAAPELLELLKLAQVQHFMTHGSDALYVEMSHAITKTQGAKP